MNVIMMKKLMMIPNMVEFYPKHGWFEFETCLGLKHNEFGIPFFQPDNPTNSKITWFNSTLTWH